MTLLLNVDKKKYPNLYRASKERLMSPEDQVKARERLAGYSWVTMVPDTPAHLKGGSRRQNVEPTVKGPRVQQDRHEDELSDEGDDSGKRVDR